MPSYLHTAGIPIIPPASKSTKRQKIVSVIAMNNWRLAGIAIACLIFAYGYSYAHAETFEDYVSFPVPDNIIKQYKMGQLITINDDILEFQVTYKFILGQNGTQWYEKKLVESGLVNVCDFGFDEKTSECLDEIIIPETIPSNFTPEKKILHQEQYEKDLEFFNENPPDTYDNKDYHELLKKWKECKRAQNSALGITQEDSFITSETVVNPGIVETQSIDGSIGRLLKAYEECIAQGNFAVMFGPIREEGEIQGKEGYFGVEQPHHSQFVRYNTEFWESIPNQSTMSSDADEHDILAEQKTAWERMCDTPKVTEKFKLDQGCPPREYPTTAKRSDGDLEVKSYILDQLNRYKQNGDTEQLDKILYESQRVENAERLKVWKAAHE